MSNRYKQFIIFAEEDLRSAGILLKEEIFNQVCFHSQQAAEKSLKSFIKFRRRLVPKIHNLSELLKICQEYEPSFRNMEDGCRYLDRFYIPTRYPEAFVGTLPEGLPTKTEAKTALEYAEDICNFIKKHL